MFLAIYDKLLTTERLKQAPEKAGETWPKARKILVPLGQERKREEAAERNASWESGAEIDARQMPPSQRTLRYTQARYIRVSPSIKSKQTPVYGLPTGDYTLAYDRVLTASECRSTVRRYMTSVTIRWFQTSIFSAE